MKKILTSTLVFVLCLFSPTKTLFCQSNLIPQPQTLMWLKGSLDLSKGIYLVDNQGGLVNEYAMVRQWAKEHALKQVNALHSKGTAKFQIKLAADAGDNEEAYRLKIDDKGISIVARTDKGVFYALQTLRQLPVSAKKIRKVHVADSPAFPWRGFLLDVGRNYQPLAMLKEQIDAMARYKLNVFHFHFTEDIAWRLESKLYPGLTAADVMTRWKGQYYTIDEFKELIAYCKARKILFLPEIDMPGHSAAFKRFFKADMQTTAGMTYLKSLIREFQQNFPELTHLHIGGDEVKIVNANFMPEMLRFTDSLGFKTLGWSPGAKLPKSTIRQLWMGGPQALAPQDSITLIDSKHLYLNHMDPLETVVTLFHRKIGEQDRANSSLIGATLCSWPDRAVNRAVDMFYQNAIYPGLLTFAERIWRGGGTAAWTCNLKPSDSKELTAFVDFERRLLLHKKRYFSKQPFPYYQQSNLKWQLIGPYENQGDLDREFGPEKGEIQSDKYYKTQLGATIILRHWWADFIKGAIENPKTNSTWYAKTKIWSDEAKIAPFWIGFNDLSRSYASNSPDSGTWDYRKSKIWINKQLVSPPQWINAGRKGDLEIPLVDEGYSYRQASQLQLRKGWNEVLVKLPIADFKGKDWQNPEKWMFTFLPLND